MRFTERIKALENETKSYKEDLNTLLMRIDETEKENYEIRSMNDMNLAEEKQKLLKEVEDIKKREENLERELSHKLEKEFYRIQHE